MNTSTSAEKEWLKKVQTGKPEAASSENKKEQKSSSAPMGSSGSTTEKKPKRGFKDVVGMDPNANKRSSPTSPRPNIFRYPPQ